MRSKSRILLCLRRDKFVEDDGGTRGLLLFTVSLLPTRWNYNKRSTLLVRNKPEVKCVLWGSTNQDHHHQECTNIVLLDAHCILFAIQGLLEKASGAKQQSCCGGDADVSKIACSSHGLAETVLSKC